MAEFPRTAALTKQRLQGGSTGTGSGVPPSPRESVGPEHSNEGQVGTRPPLPAIRSALWGTVKRPATELQAWCPNTLASQKSLVPSSPTPLPQPGRASTCMSSATLCCDLPCSYPTKSPFHLRAGFFPSDNSPVPKALLLGT